MNPRTTQHSITVSIVIPCFNHGQYIQEALDSIDHKKINYNIQVIIVDDGSTDNNTLQKDPKEYKLEMKMNSSI